MATDTLSKGDRDELNKLIRELEIVEAQLREPSDTLKSLMFDTYNQLGVVRSSVAERLNSSYAKRARDDYQIMLRKGTTP